VLFEEEAVIVTKIVENLADLPGDVVTDLKVDYVVFDNEERLKRVQRARTQGGEEIALRFPTDFRELSAGDVLYRDDERVIAAKIAPVDVLIIKPRTIREMGTVAHTLGNRHLQAQFFADDHGFEGAVMVVRYDHTVEHTLEHLGVPFERAEREMPAAFRHAEHSH